jgi:LexA-binding, inner membrane-associated putative hydrolase
MPSPLGHALAGLAAGWAVAPRRPGSDPGGPVTHFRPLGRRGRTAFWWGCLFAAAGTAADLDLLASLHRGPTHSLAAALAAGATAWVWMLVWGWLRARSGGGDAGNARERRPASLRRALAVTAACATHTLLDWLGADSSPPFGIMALWPLTHGYYESSQHVFLAISRRYWLPDFWTLNLHAIARELAILGPVTALVLWLRRPTDDAQGRPGAN